MDTEKIPGLNQNDNEEIEEIVLGDKAPVSISEQKKEEKGGSFTQAETSENEAAPVKATATEPEKAQSLNSTENKADTKEEDKEQQGFFKKLLADGFDLFSLLGEFFTQVTVKTLIIPFKILAGLSRFIWEHTRIFRITMKQIFGEVGAFFSGPFIRTKRALSITRTRIQQANEEGNRKKAFKIYAGAISEAIFGKRGLAVTLFNYAAPIVAVLFLVNVVGYATKTNYAIKLTVNGKFLGYVQNEQVFTDAERLMQERITYMDSDRSTIEMTPEYSLEMLGDQGYLTKFQLVNEMMKISDTTIEYAYGMYIGDKFYGALVDTTEVQNELDKILNSYRTGVKDEDVAFEKDITYQPGLYLSDSIVQSEDIIKIINSKKNEASYYSIQEGDSPYAVCAKLDMSLEELTALNPEIADEDYMFVVGEKLLKTQEVPFLSVSISRTEEYEVAVPYDTEYTTNDTTYQGVQTIVQDGEEGSNKITAKVYYVNGEEVKRTIVKTQRIKDPVTKIISEGTLAPQSSHVSTDSADVGKLFIWPVENGTFWEWGWWDGGYAGHRGVDIGAPYGNDVYAGASGTVIYSGYDYGGLGNCVMIQHGADYNYLITVYAHNSELFVYAGQEVTQGQCIAAIGETGRAYGCHCHFEVRNGSERLNPRYYLSGLPSLY